LILPSPEIGWIDSPPVAGPIFESKNRKIIALNILFESKIEAHRLLAVRRRARACCGWEGRHCGFPVRCVRYACAGAHGLDFGELVREDGLPVFSCSFCAMAGCSLSLSLSLSLSFALSLALSLSVREREGERVCLRERVCAWMSEWVIVGVRVCVWNCLRACEREYLIMYVCVYVCVYVCMCVCVCVYMCVCMWFCRVIVHICTQAHARAHTHANTHAFSYLSFYTGA